MREFTKSILSYTWAMSLFGVQQAFNVVRPQQQRPVHPATNAFNHVTGAAREELGGALEPIFRAGDNVQRGLVDATFSIMTLGFFNRGDRSRGTSTVGATQAASDLGRGTAEVFQQSASAARQAADVIGRAVGANLTGPGRKNDSWPQASGESIPPNPAAER